MHYRIHVFRPQDIKQRSTFDLIPTFLGLLNINDLVRLYLTFREPIYLTFVRYINVFIKSIFYYELASFS